MIEIGLTMFVLGVAFGHYITLRKAVTKKDLEKIRRKIIELI